MTLTADTPLSITHVNLDAFEAILDDDVPCNMQAADEPDPCARVAQWRWYCRCGEAWIACDWHRDDVNESLRRVPRGWEHACRKCDTSLPVPIPWLPL